MKMLYLKINWIVLILGILSSCTSNPARRIPPTNLNAVAGPNQTEVYITRVDKDKKNNLYTAVYLNGSLQAEIALGGIEKIIVQNGNHEISVAYGSRQSVPIKFNANGSRVDFRANLFLSNYSWQLTLIQEGVRNPTYIDRAAEQTFKNVPKGLKIAIVYMTFPNNQSTSDFITGELEVILVNDGYTIIDRSQLDRIRQEQNFQLSGEVDDETAVSIGKFAGADIIVTGKVDGEYSRRRLRLRALNTQTAQVVGASSEHF